MRIQLSFILDWILFIAFSAFIFMAMDILPVIWSVLYIVIGDRAIYMPDIFIGIPLVLLLFYTAFIRKQRNIASYIWYIALVIILTQIYYTIDGPYKRMHIFEYFLLSIICFKVLHHYFHDERVFLIGFLMAAFFGVADECLQHFSPARGFSLLDIKADACAALLGQLFIMLVIRPDLKPWVPKLRKKIKGYHAQQRWLEKQNRI
jgi:hypothetical protein